VSEDEPAAASAWHERVAVAGVLESAERGKVVTVM
jgi:hypothetical protein